jgi:hypothetical protein
VKLLDVNVVLAPTATTTRIFSRHERGWIA